MKKNSKKIHHSAKIDREKILEALRNRPMSTIELRHGLDCLGVAPRIWELRHDFNFNIRSQWTRAQNPGGTEHCVVIYSLHTGPYKKGEKQ